MSKSSTQYDAKTSILQAALEEIAEVGLGNTRTASIAKRAGVASGLIHYHFGTKDKLYIALVDSFMDTSFVDDLTIIPYHRKCTTLEKMHLLLESLVVCTFMHKTKTHMRFMLQIMSGGEDAIRPVMEKYDFYAERYILYLIKKGIEEGVFETTQPAIAASEIIKGVIMPLTAFTHFKDFNMQSEFMPEPYEENFKEYYVESCLRKLIKPNQHIEIPPIPDDLKKISETYIEALHSKKWIIDWKVIVRLYATLFDEPEDIMSHM